MMGTAMSKERRNLRDWLKRYSLQACCQTCMHARATTNKLHTRCALSGGRNRAMSVCCLHEFSHPQQVGEEADLGKAMQRLGDTEDRA